MAGNLYLSHPGSHEYISDLHFLGMAEYKRHLTTLYLLRIGTWRLCYIQSIEERVWSRQQILENTFRQAWGCWRRCFRSKEATELHTPETKASKHQGSLPSAGEDCQDTRNRKR